MMATWEDLEQDVGDRENETEVVNLCFMANIEVDEETMVEVSELELSYDELLKAYNKLLNDSHTLST